MEAEDGQVVVTVQNLPDICCPWKGLFSFLFMNRNFLELRALYHDKVDIKNLKALN